MLRDRLQSLDSVAPPMARLLSAPLHLPPQRLGVLCGSFNPLTLAHVALAQHACRAFHLDQLLYTVAKVTVDKERVTGMGLEDRLLLLLLHVEQQQHLGVALVNRGLYFEQAQAFQSLFDTRVGLFFIVGMDKLVQILDARYYRDRGGRSGAAFCADFACRRQPRRYGPDTHSTSCCSGPTISPTGTRFISCPCLRLLPTSPQPQYGRPSVRQRTSRLTCRPRWRGFSPKPGHTPHRAARPDRGVRSILTPCA